MFSFIPSVFLLSTSHQRGVKLLKWQTQRIDRLNAACSCIFPVYLNCIVSAAVQPNRPQGLFLCVEETEMSFLSVRADGRSKNHTHSSSETSLSAKCVLMGARLLIVTLEISQDSKRQRLCHSMTGAFQVSTGTCWSPPFTLVWRNRGRSLLLKDWSTVLLKKGNASSKRSSVQNVSSLVFRSHWTLSLPTCHSPECFQGSEQEEVVMFMARFLLELAQGWAWEIWRVLLCAGLVCCPRLVFAYGCCDNN